MVPAAVFAMMNGEQASGLFPVFTIPGESAWKHAP